MPPLDEACRLRQALRLVDDEGLGVTQAGQSFPGRQGAAARNRCLSISTSKLRNRACSPARQCSTKVVFPTCRAPSTIPILDPVRMLDNSPSAILLIYIENSIIVYYVKSIV